MNAEDWIAQFEELGFVLLFISFFKRIGLVGLDRIRYIFLSLPLQPKTKTKTKKLRKFSPFSFEFLPFFYHLLFPLFCFNFSLFIATIQPRHRDHQKWNSRKKQVSLQYFLGWNILFYAKGKKKKTLISSLLFYFSPASFLSPNGFHLPSKKKCSEITSLPFLRPIDSRMLKSGTDAQKVNAKIRREFNRLEREYKSLADSLDYMFRNPRNFVM